MKMKKIGISLSLLVSVLLTGCGDKTKEVKAENVTKSEATVVQTESIIKNEEKVTKAQEEIAAEKKKRGPFRYTETTTIDQMLWHYNSVEEKFEEFKDKIFTKDLQLKLYKASNGRLYFTSLTNHDSIYVYCTNYGAKPSLEEFKNVKNGKMIIIKSPKEDSKYLNSSKHRPINVHNKDGLKNRAYFLDDNRVYMMTNGEIKDFKHLEMTLSKIEKSIDYLYGTSLANESQVFKIPHWGLNFNCVKIDNDTLLSFSRNKLLNYNSHKKEGCKEPNMFPIGRSISNHTNPSLLGIEYKFDTLKYF